MHPMVMVTPRRIRSHLVFSHLDDLEGTKRDTFCHTGQCPGQVRVACQQLAIMPRAAGSNVVWHTMQCARQVQAARLQLAVMP